MCVLRKAEQEVGPWVSKMDLGLPEARVVTS